jgi:hypothetical protein
LTGFATVTDGGGGAACFCALSPQPTTKVESEITMMTRRSTALEGKTI